MYSMTKFYDREMFACSVPPSCNENLSEEFSELSRIHFYLGRHPIDFMIKGVEQASLTDIEKGKIQIYFAVKEIQDYLFRSLKDISISGEDKFEPNLYFNKTFESILNHTIEVIDYAYKKPTKKDNVTVIETMLGLAQEVKYFSSVLQEVNINTNVEQKLNEIVEKYQKILDIKPHYSNLEKLKPFSDYEADAKNSVLAQLKEPYEFNYAKLCSIYFDDDTWVYTLGRIREEQKDIDTNPDYKFNPKEAQKLKDDFLKQIKSINRLFQNGVVNYTLSYAATLSKEAFYKVENSKVSAEAYFAKELRYHEKGLKSIYGDTKGYHADKIKELKKNEKDYIKQKNEDKLFYEQHITIIHRQEQNIYQSLDKVRAKLFDAEVKNTLTLEGDINLGFVVGRFNNKDDILVVHKDTTVNATEAVYAMMLNGDYYDELVENGKLVFDIDFKHDTKRKYSANFWNYGQFLQELSNPICQQNFLGQEVYLVDNTMLKDLQRKKVSMHF